MMRAALACTLLLSTTASAQHIRTLESSRLLRDSVPLSVRLVLGTGTLSVGAADAPYLFRSIARFGNAFAAPVSAWNPSQRVLTLTAGQRDESTGAGDDDAQENENTREWRVQLTRRAPLELAITATAADATLDLTGLPLRRFSLNTGAAAATVRFDAPNPEPMSLFDADVGAGGLKLIGLGNAGASEARIEGDVGDIALDLGGRWQRDMQVSISSAVGTVQITAPPTIGVELDTPGFMTRADVVGRFTKSGRTWRSQNYADASVKVRITVRTVLGKVELVQR
jgi:hypothetical protein